MAHGTRNAIEVRFHPRVHGISAVFVRRTVSKTLNAERRGTARRAPTDRSVNVYVTTDAEIRRINKKYLKHDYATDVISFETGDIAVSVDFARAYGKKHGIPFRQELARYLVHGTLHLLGYDDRRVSDYKKMHRRQEQILKKIHA